MKIRGKKTLEKFSKKHNDARNPLQRWVRIVEISKWDNFNELRKTFASADLVVQKNIKYVIFNIAGNKYRLATTINFKGQLVNKNT